LQQGCRERCNKGFSGVLFRGLGLVLANFCDGIFKPKQPSFACHGPSEVVPKYRSLNLVSTGSSKLWLDSSLRPMKSRGLLVAIVCKFFFFYLGML
jgi:hypothetical protein